MESNKAIKEVTEDQISKSKIWELPIYEIKYVDPIKGMHFRLGQRLSIGQPIIAYEVSHIIRDVIDGEIMYMVFGTAEGETKLLKATSGIAVYLTFSV